MDSITTDLNVSKLSQLTETAITQLTGVGLKILGAIVLFLIGRWLIRWALRLMSAAFNRQHFDHTLISYVNSAVSVGLNIVLIIALLGYFGVETTSFAALIAAMGYCNWCGLGGIVGQLRCRGIPGGAAPFQGGRLCDDWRRHRNRQGNWLVFIRH